MEDGLCVTCRGRQVGSEPVECLCGSGYQCRLCPSGDPLSIHDHLNLGFIGTNRTA